MRYSNHPRSPLVYGRWEIGFRRPKSRANLKTTFRPMKPALHVAGFPAKCLISCWTKFVMVRQVLRDRLHLRGSVELPSINRCEAMPQKFLNSASNSMARLYLSLGSNLGQRARHLRMALAMLSSAGVRILRSSKVYETKPLEDAGPRWFLNCVLECETSLSPMEVLAQIHRIEFRAGRPMPPRERARPRSLDIDILFWDNLQVTTRCLVIPHRSWRSRTFILRGLSDLWPLGEIPGTGLTWQPRPHSQDPDINISRIKLDPQFEPS
jgi:2-amino-4-hydroxy-6-hydroxymethyldihydropteridine diphosphokinase